MIDNRAKGLIFTHRGASGERVQVRAGWRGGGHSCTPVPEIVFQFNVGTPPLPPVPRQSILKCLMVGCTLRGYTYWSVFRVRARSPAFGLCSSGLYMDSLTH